MLMKTTTIHLISTYFSNTTLIQAFKEVIYARVKMVLKWNPNPV